MSRNRSRSVSRPGPLGLLPLAALAAAFAAPAHGAENTGGKDPGVIVTATRVATPAGEVASSTTVVTAAQIEQMQYRTLVDILNDVPGMQVTQSGGRGKLTSVFTRGTESNHTLFLVNGIEVGDPSAPGGVFQLENLSADNIERVEIVRGPQSGLYGSDAIGGVINVITKKGARGIVTSASIEGGSFSTVQVTAGLDGTRGPVDFNIHVSRLTTHGQSVLSKRVGGGERDGYKNQTVSARLGVHPTDWLDLDAFFQHVYARNDIDPFTDDPNAFTKGRNNIGKFAATFHLFGEIWTSKVALTYNEVDRRSINRPDPASATNTVSVFRSNKPKFEWQNDIKVLKNNTVTLGTSIEAERGQAGGSSFFGFSKKVINRAVYVQDQFSFWGRVFGSVGARLDDHGLFGPEVTYKAALAYLHKETGTKIMATYGTGFKAPALDELFGFNPGFPPFFPAFVGNPNLKPEKSMGFDVGIEQTFLGKRVTVGTTYFQNRIKNLIIADFAVTFTNLNVSRARTWGLESFVKAKISDRVSLRLDHTFLRAKDLTTNSELPRRPRHKATLSLIYRPIEGAQAILGVRSIGGRRDFAFTGGTVTLKTATTVRLAGSYDVTRNFTLFARIENLLGNRYENPDGFAQPSFSGFVGLRSKFTVLD